MRGKVSISELDDGTLLVFLKSPPVDSKANAELIKLLADRLDLPKSYINSHSALQFFDRVGCIVKGSEPRRCVTLRDNTPYFHP